MSNPDINPPRPPELGPSANRNARRLANITGGNTADIITQARAAVPGATAGNQIGAVIRELLRQAQGERRETRRAERTAALEGTPADPAVQAEAEATRRAIQRRGRGRASTILTAPGAAVPTGQVARKALLGQ